MKTFKILLMTLLFSSLFTSCLIVNDDIVDNSINLEEVVSNYDLWYVDYHSTQGTGDVSFLSKAFTVSFLNGTMYANNNIADLGYTGNGFGIAIGDYYTDRGVLEAEHSNDGYYNFEVVQLSRNEIRIDDRDQNVSYYLIGYQSNNFDYDQVFYENIEYFLQDYIAWERTALEDGMHNVFDKERFLQFVPKNNTTFYSSTDYFGTNVANLQWDFVGSYTIYDVTGYNDLKGLTLNYKNGDTETFELTVLSDETIQLYHQSSQTTYTFVGKGFILQAKGTESIEVTNDSDRTRTIIKRETVDRKNLK